MSTLRSKKMLEQTVKQISKKWNFPTKISHLDQLGHKLIETKPDSNSIQYQDTHFRSRRLAIGEMAKDHKMGFPIKQVSYNQMEHDIWRTALRRLKIYHQDVMSHTYLQNMAELQISLNFSANIPKINDLSNYLIEKSGFRLKPAGGMLDQRQFLNCLAFGVFCTGQFIRHPQSIDCAPEPDLIHDFVGHIPMFADPQIAAISQEIGLLSLGANDEEIKRLSYAYIYTIQLGLCLEGGKQKAFGAAIASGLTDLKNISMGKYDWKEFEPETDCLVTIEDYSKPFERFYLSKCISSTLESLLKHRNTIDKPFICKYDRQNQQIQVHQT